MKTYERYKPSGVEWIGDIPEHWNVKRLKFVANVQSSNVDKKTFDNETPILLCNYVDVYKNEFIRDNIEFMNATATEKEIERFILDKGDVLITKDSETPDDIANPALVTKDFENVICGYHLAQIKPDKIELCGEYLFRLFQSKRFNSYFEVAANGITRFGLSLDEITGVFVSLPPLTEQTAIAKYLDDKTAQVDKLIAVKQKLIELLKEERLGVINHAVTRGVYPHAKLKTSGIQWIGDIPEHWEVKKLKFIASIKGRIGFRGYNASDIVNSGEGALTIGAKHISKSNKLNLANPEFISWEKFYESPEIEVKKGQMLVVQRGTLGKVVLIEEELGSATINPSILILKDFKTNPYYLIKYFTSRCFTAFIELINSGTAVPMISQEQLGNFFLPIPPPSEQNKIIQFIEAETDKIDVTIVKIEKEIEYLREYRTTLISEVVTGKIKVV